MIYFSQGKDEKNPLNHLVSPFSCLVSGERVTSAKVAALKCKGPGKVSQHEQCHGFSVRKIYHSCVQAPLQ